MGFKKTTNVDAFELSHECSFRFAIAEVWTKLIQNACRAALPVVMGCTPNYYLDFIESR